MGTTTEQKAERITRIKIGNTDIFFEDFECGKGKITVSDTLGHNYSMYWGAMGGTIKDFILSINDDYFTSKLLGSRLTEVFCAKSTFRAVRKFIREDLDLPWYKHIEFQKHLREVINDFQDSCIENEGSNYFVDQFSFYFRSRPNFYLIENKWERERIEKEFNEISEPWLFINTKESEESKWLRKLHSEIKKYIQENG